MENAVEALKTAAAVLIFVMAITISFTMFSKAKQTADAVVTSQDKQEYLESADLDNGILYTSSNAIGTSASGESGSITDKSSIAGMTIAGDRIVDKDDVISTIYRYNLEKYGVTLIDSSGTVLVRFDSNTESVVRQWNNIMATTNGSTAIDEYEEQIADNISVSRYYFTVTNVDLEDLYRITEDGNTASQKTKVGAPWYGNDAEIIKRINADINGEEYELNNLERDITQTTAAKGINDILESSSKIIEVINEIDNSKYLTDDSTKTSLLQQYELPTIEVVYIIY